jgi:ATP-dependent exoDNAse (exonuclease V) alpha subunit
VSIFHCSVKVISAGKGRSAVAASAYRSGEKLYDEKTGIEHDYTRKSGVVHSEVQLCDNAPQKFKNRETLWNEVQKVENTAKSRYAREVEVALPREFSRDEQIKVVRQYVKENFVDRGMCADWSIHDKGDGNPHAHIMLTTRSIRENGEWAPKAKNEYVLDKNGERILQKIDKDNRRIYKRQKLDFNDWNDKRNVQEWRESWAQGCNRYLDSEHRIDSRSYEKQGVDIVPTLHEGYVARQMERRGYVSELCEKNREISERNSFLVKIQTELKEIQQRITQAIKEKGGDLHDRIEKYRDQLTRRTPQPVRAAEQQDSRAGTGDTESLVERARAQLADSHAAIDRDNAALREREAYEESRRRELDRAKEPRAFQSHHHDQEIER